MALNLVFFRSQTVFQMGSKGNVGVSAMRRIVNSRLDKKQVTFNDIPKYVQTSPSDQCSGTCVQTSLCLRRCRRGYGLTSVANTHDAKRRLLTTVVILIVFACSYFDPSKWILPQAHASPLCGSQLVDKLRILCGPRGIYNPLVTEVEVPGGETTKGPSDSDKLTRSGSTASEAPRDIIAMCCKRSCTLRQLKHYCGSSRGSRADHYRRVYSMLPVNPERARRPRLPPRRSSGHGTSRDDSDTPTIPSAPLFRTSRHITRDGDRFSNMPLQQFLKNHAADYVRKYSGNGDEQVVLTIAKFHLYNKGN